MKTIKVSEATGAVLDWMVCSVQHPEATMSATHVWLPAGDAEDDFLIERTSTDWAQGGALIEREGIGFFCNRTTATGARFTPDAGADWRAFALNKHGVHYFGPTPLIAAMRCFCASRLGDEVEIPKELMT